MKTIVKSLSVLFLLNVYFSLSSVSQQERPLWPNGIPNNPVKYNQEKVRTSEVNASSPSQKNRVFSQVSEPTYTLFNAKKPNGVAVVICPGGGFRDVWFDREGVDFALWLAERGITSLVLKYRTFNSDAEGFSLKREVYNPEVLADAKQAIHILRSQANDLKIDKNKIGIGGFSAGGALSLYAALNIYEKDLPGYARFSESTAPDFVFPVYPGISDEVYKAVQQNENIPPMFLINGAEDTVTPALKCIRLYTDLLEKGVRAEIHVYAKGNHGFDSGIGRGFGVASWQESFIDWLKDLKFME